MSSFAVKLNMGLLALLVLMTGAIIAILAPRASGGPLDPAGPPASTMHTLADTPPSWDQILDATNGAPGPTNPLAGCNSDRFKCVMTYPQCGGACITLYPAVLDEETGLVWQRSPDTQTYSWAAAILLCALENTGQRRGWRLPTQAELNSLKGPSAEGTVPAGSPFGPAGGAYWTSTESAMSPADQAVMVGIGSGLESYILEPKTTSGGRWCVRGASSSE